MSSNTDLYAALGVERTATIDEIKKAYRKLARRYHPDVNPGNKQAEDKFKEVAAANDVLTDPEKRKLYDEFGLAGLESGFDPARARAHSSWNAESAQRPGGPFSEGDFGGYSNFDDILGDLFGRSQRNSVQSGEDMEAQLQVDLLDAIRGTSTEISVTRPVSCATCTGRGTDPGSEQECGECKGRGKVAVGRGPMRLERACPVCGGRGRTGTRPCPTCHGEGRRPATERLRVKIPAGVDEGTRIRLAGKGAEGLGGGPAGDLYIVVRLRPHERLERKDHDLYMDLPITAGEALLGATITVPTPHGQVRVKIPTNSQSGKLLRIREHGVPKPGSGRGDFYLRLQIWLPQPASERVRSAIDEIESAYETHPRASLSL